MAITHTTAVRTALADALSTYVGANAKLIIYNGTPPANAQAALSGNTAIATITTITVGTSTAGVLTFSGSTADAAAVGGSGASFFRLTKSDGTTAVFQGTVGTSGADAIVNSTTIAAGANVSLTGTNTYTAPL